MNPRLPLLFLPATLLACSGAATSDLFATAPPSDAQDAGAASPEPVQTPGAADAGSRPIAVVDAGGGIGPGLAVDASSGGDTSADDAGAPDASLGADSAPPVTGETQTVQMTFYGWNDNTPPGNTIAYPKSGGFPTVHKGAGGTGTYADPVTLATDELELPVGTLVYASVLEKYLVMEDDCGACDTDWSTSKKWHVNVWMNSNGADSASALAQCEGAWSQSATTIEINPPQGRSVSTSALFDPASNTCRTSP